MMPLPMKSHPLRRLGLSLACGVATCLALCFGAEARATSSIFNAEGLGRWMDHYDIAARGAGWTAIGVTDPNQMSSINPASIGWVDQPQVFVGLVAQNLWIESSESSGRDRVGDTRLPSINLVLPLPSQLRVGIGFRDLTEGSYEVSVIENEGRDDELERRREGTGSLGELFFSFGGRFLRDRVAAAVRYGITSGTLREQDEVNFANSPYVDTQNVLRTRMENARPFYLGIQAKATEQVSLGAFYGASAAVDLKSLLTTSSGFQSEQRADFDLPATYGFGASVVLGRFRVSGDWSRRSWTGSEFQVVEGDPVPAGAFTRFVDADRVGFGLVRLPDAEQSVKDPLYERAVWRLGFTMGDLSVTQRDGSEVNEWAVTGGLGLPVQFDRGYVDGLIEFGRRGNLEDVGVRETYLRLGFGVTFSRLQRTF